MIEFRWLVRPGSEDLFEQRVLQYRMVPMCIEWDIANDAPVVRPANAVVSKNMDENFSSWIDVPDKLIPLPPPREKKK